MTNQIKEFLNIFKPNGVKFKSNQNFESNSNRISNLSQVDYLLHILHKYLYAKNGNVYSFSTLVTPSIIHQDVYAPKQIGIEDASTFTGFCSFHDNKVFEPIDSHFFEVTPHHIFLVSYRCLCLALFRQKIIIEKGPHLKKSNKEVQKRSIELESVMNFW